MENLRLPTITLLAPVSPIAWLPVAIFLFGIGDAPAILPGLLVMLCLTLFGAWMVVLIAEATRVGYGLGPVIMLARNTFNPGLVFFTIVLIGLTGFMFDYGPQTLQSRLLCSVPKGQGSPG